MATRRRDHLKAFVSAGRYAVLDRRTIVAAIVKRTATPPRTEANKNVLEGRPCLLGAAGSSMKVFVDGCDVVAWREFEGSGFDREGVLDGEGLGFSG
jgi:hypothetical protein